MRGKIIVLEDGLPPREAVLIKDVGSHTEVTVEPARMYETALEDDNAAFAAENVTLKNDLQHLRWVLRSIREKLDTLHELGVTDINVEKFQKLVESHLQKRHDFEV